MVVSADCAYNKIKEIGRRTESRLQHEHQIDNLYMLVYTILMALSVLTIWLFKHRRFRYIHETGLSLIYGLIVGCIFKYGVGSKQVTSQIYTLPPSPTNTCFERLPPEKALLRLNMFDETNTSIYYHYTLERQSRDTHVNHFRLTFNPEIFFNVLLPPIIFTAGYSMKRKHFFRNFGSISLFAFLGTFISAMSIALICYGLTRIIPSLSDKLLLSECVYFGALISATDPVTVLAIFNDMHVDMDLYALVFGESVLNDVVAIGLTKAVEKFDSVASGTFTPNALLASVVDFVINFGASFLLGSVIGCFTALLTKYTHIRDYPLLETVLFVLLSYSTFFLSEAVGYTGIVALLFCGITQAHYTYNNLSKDSQVWTKQAFELLNFLAENFVFAYIGVSTFTFNSHNWNVWFIFITIFACLAARALDVYSMAALINCVRLRLFTKCCFKNRNNFGLGRLYSSPSIIEPIVENDSHFHNSADLTDTSSIEIRFNLTNQQNSATEHIAPPFQSQTEKDVTIGWNKQHLLVFAGLRGAMAFSLAIRNTSTSVKQMFFSTTIVVVISTVFIGGCISTPLMQWLKIPVRNSKNNADDPNQNYSSKQVAKSNAYTRRKGCWSRFDSRFMKPLLTHSGPLLSENLPRCCSRLANFLTTTDQFNNAFAQSSSNSQNRLNTTKSINSHQEMFKTRSV